MEIGYLWSLSMDCDFRQNKKLNPGAEFKNISDMIGAKWKMIIS